MPSSRCTTSHIRLSSGAERGMEGALLSKEATLRWILALALVACAHNEKPEAPAAPVAAAAPAIPSGNPFLQPSSLPLQYPPFDRIHDGDYVPAYEAGMAQHLAEVEAIAKNR